MADSSPEILPDTASVVIVGGGIAGLSAAMQLAAFGQRDVVLLETEAMFASHASARNAAIFLPLEESPSAVWMASRSRDLLDAQLGTSWLSATGVALVSAVTDPLDELRYNARRFGVYHERWSAVTTQSRVPAVLGGEAHHALFLPLGGVIDIHAVLGFLRKRARQAGVHMLTGARVLGIETTHRKVTAVTLADGRTLRAERVVIAAGAWSEALGKSAGAPLTLTPMRRHLMQLQPKPLADAGSEDASADTVDTADAARLALAMPALRWKHPVVWRLDNPAYFRPESGGVLASPCDETPDEPGVPAIDDTQLDVLTRKLAALAPSLTSLGVRHTWACLRTMSEDREPVVGADPRVDGLFWIAGLGGRGMTCGVAAGELLARAVAGLGHPMARVLSPERFI